MDQDLGDDRTPAAAAEPELSEPLDGTEVREHEAGIKKENLEEYWWEDNDPMNKVDDVDDSSDSEDEEITQGEVEKALGDFAKNLEQESLKEDFLDDIENDTNIYDVNGLKLSAVDLYDAINDSIDSYRFDNEDGNIDISQSEAEEIAHEAFKELTDPKCKKAIYQVVSELLGL